MKLLCEFGQTDLREGQHIVLGGQTAHQRFQRLQGIFGSGLRGGKDADRFELATPQPSQNALGKQVIRFLTDHDNMVPVKDLPEDQRTRAEQQFQRVVQQIHNKHKAGDARDWADEIFKSCVLYSNGQTLSIAWGLPFTDIDRYQYQQPVEVAGTDTNPTEGGTGNLPPLTPPVTPPVTPTSTPIETPPPEVKKGCTDPQASNYDADATEDDGSCEYEHIGPIVYGPVDTVRGHRPWWMWVLLALLLLLIAMVLLSLDGCNGHAATGLHYSPVTGRYEPNPLPGFTPDQPNQMTPIAEGRIVEDPTTGDRIAQGRWNVYPKNQDIQFSEFLSDLRSVLPDEAIQVTDYCNETRRVQLDIGDRDGRAFKTQLKKELSRYDLLVWPERIMSASQSTGEPLSSRGQDWHLEAIHARQAWQQQTGMPNVTVAIIDSGFDTEHPDLDQDTVSAYHVALRQHEVYASPSIIHGTHVAGLAIAQHDDDRGASGVGHGCSWMPIQLTEQNDEDGFPSSFIVDGVLYAMNHGADVINLSLGSGINPDLFVGEDGSASLENYILNTADEAEFWNEIYQLGERNNCLFVMAAGNNAMPLELDPMHRSPLPVYVAATNQANQIAAEFSNFPTGDLLIDHPGVCVAAPGDDVYSCEVDGNLIPMPGTSMASPLVSGATGLLRSAAPGLSNQDLRTLLHNMRTTVSSADMEAWELLNANLIEMGNTTWTLDAQKERPEQVTLNFRSGGTMTCSNCNEDYKRGQWSLSASHLYIQFEDADGRITSTLDGSWHGEQFSGGLTMHMWDELGTFTLTPTSTANLTVPYTAIPLLNVEELLNALPSQSI